VTGNSEELSKFSAFHKMLFGR